MHPITPLAAFLCLLLTSMFSHVASSSKGDPFCLSQIEAPGAATTADTLEILPGSRLVKCGIVLKRGKRGEWDAGMIESPVIWFDENRKRYAMVYTGYDHANTTKLGYAAVSMPQIGLAWSDDLFSWEKDSRNPIFRPSGAPGSPDGSGTAGPFIWFERGTYYLFYFGTTASGYEKGLKTLNLAVSTDLYTWRRYEGNPVISPQGTDWRRDAIWHPNITKVGEKYFLFFNASGVVDGINEEYIGYATSADLFHWKVDDANSPLLIGSRNPSAWDASGRTGDPSLYKVGNRWFMAYYSWDRNHAQDGLAWTTEAGFPLGWQPYGGNPILRIGEPGSFDDQHAAKPFIFRTKDQHFHFTRR